GVPAYVLPVDASPGTLPYPTQDSGPDCWLRFVRAAITDGWTVYACKAQPRPAPGVRFSRTGLFNVTRLRTLLLLSPYQSQAYWLHNSWSCYRELLEQVLESLPGITDLLTPAIQPFVQALLDMVIELCQAGSVAVHSIVVVVPTE